MTKLTDADIGKKVVLPENKEEGWAEEIGELLQISKTHVTIIVQLDPQYIGDDPADDGIRECLAEGVFLLEEREQLEKSFDQVTSLHSEIPKK